MSIKVNIRLLGVFRGLSDKSQLSFKSKKPTVRNVILKLSASLPVEARRLLIDPELDDPRPNALILVNGKETSVLKGLETELEDGDEVTLIPVSHGG
jgi:molybdopterin converting factor small subunit